MKPRARRLLAAALSVCVLIVAAAGTAGTWKPILKKKSRWFVVATNIYQDLLRRTHLRADQIGQGEATRTAADVPQSLEAIDATFEGYLQHAGLRADELHGKRVLELGPGDNVGVALRFAAAGAGFVSTIDKFVPLQDSDYHRSLYRALRSSLQAEERRRFDEAIDLDDGKVALRGDRLEYVYGKGFEKTDTYTPNSFDFIVSNAVLEEIYDIDAAFAGMDRLIRPGGYLLHKIDLRDYGMFSNHDFHPLEFLTISDTVYQRMVESSGQPNRRLIDYYRRKTAQLSYDTTIYTSWVLGNPRELTPHKTRLVKGVDYPEATLDLIEAIRPRLLPRYQQLPAEDLMIQGIYLVARKAPAGVRGR